MKIAADFWDQTGSPRRRGPRVGRAAQLGAWLVLLAILMSGTELLGQMTTVKASTPVSQARSGTVTSPVNRELPRWIRLSGEFRTRAEGRTAYGFLEDADDAYVLTRFRLGLDIAPSPWLHFFVQGQDSRVMSIEPSRATTGIKNVFDLRQAYVEMKPQEKAWVSLKAGRQELNLGGQRLVGGGDWGNVTRTYDAVRVSVGGEDVRFDFFAASAVAINYSRFDKVHPGQNLHGVYGVLSKVVPKATLEPYVLWKTLPLVSGENGAPGDADIYTFGLRWVGMLPKGFDYAFELAGQGGHFAQDSVRSWGGYGIVGYASSLPLKPRFSAEYTCASGDKDRTDQKVGTFDTLYAAVHGVFGGADLFSWRNVRHLRGGVEVKPHRQVALTLDYHSFWLASRQDSLYGAAGTVLVNTPTGGSLYSHVGQEADFYLKYNPRPEVTVGAGYSHLFAGRYLREHSPGSGASYPYLFCSYRF